MKTLFNLIIALALAGGVFAQSTSEAPASGNVQNTVAAPVFQKSDAGVSSTQIPMANLGMEADKKVDKQLPYMDDNAAVIECPLQAMRGNVSANGLVIKSLSKEEGVGDFILRPLSYSKGELNTLGNGLISIENNAVLLHRGNLTERFTASTDGIRQDFILANAPVGTKDLSVMLELKGAVATNSAQGVSIKMDNGRKLEYHNLYITDAAGKVLKGEMKAVSEGLIAINVNDADAVYPLTIDPTVTDADWVALNTSIPGTDYDINAIAISGTDIYVGGAFAAAGSGLANRIAKWDGSAWSALGSGVSGTVYSLAISGTDLYVGGYFATAGGITVNNIAKWDITTSTWSALGSGVSSDVKALAISGTDVYAGGVFTTAGGNPANYIAKWNGTAWSALGAGLDLRVLCIAISGTDIYVGGRFRNAGGSSADRIAKWNITTSTWSALGSGTNNYVLALAINGTDLYAGGSFSTAGGNSANRIAKWNITTSAWSALGSGLSGNSNEARAIAISGSDVYVGGAFTTAGGVTVGRIAKWDGTSWSALGSGLNDNLQAIAISGSGDLYVGGYFTSAGDVVASKIAKWNGTAWSALGSGLNASVSAIAINGGDMYIGGGLLQVGNVPASKIAKWNGSVWSALGTGVELTNGRNVSAIAISGGDVYVGGGFTTAGGITVNNIAKWDGTAWSALGSGVGSSVTSIAISGSDVYAGGSFTTAGGTAANYIAKWNGTAWSALGTGLNSSVADIAINGSNVYAGGPFTTAGGNPANYIAKWDGTSWSALGSGLGAQLTSIAISGSNVYAAGAFTTAGGVAANYIAKWDETTATWTALGSGVNSYIYTIATTGSDVYVGGGFTTAGGVSANSIAKWDGTAWSALGSGVNASPYALAMSGTSELIVGGGFMTAGDKFSPYLAKVVIPPAPTMFEFTPTSAATGETVTISGTNLTGATAVSFGGTAAASFTVVDATSITAVVATGTSGSVSVTTAGGTATLAGFTYIANITWTGTTSTAWNTGSNWSTGSVPTASDNVTIPDVANDPVVNLAPASPAVCNNLTIESGAVLTIPAGKALTVNGAFTNNAGITGLMINSGGSLIQNSTAVAATVKRAIAGDNKFHLFISPVNESVVANGTSCFNGAYVDRYQESAGQWVRLATGDNVVSTYGYSVNFANGTPELTFPGTLKASPVSYTNLSYTSAAPGYGAGWNLAGNPYPCGINTALLTAPTGMNAIAYVWDETGSGNYITHTIGAASATPGIIAPMQGFFVNTSSATNSLVMANAAKVHGGTFYKSSKTIPQMLSLSIAGNGYSDKTYVRFDPSATENFDQAFDAYKLSGLDEAPQLYSMLTIEKASINSLPSITANQHVPLGLKVGTTATYTIQVEGISSFDPLVPISLDDLKLGTSHDLRLNPVYSFTASPADAENRFRLSFATITSMNEPDALGINVSAVKGIIHVKCEGTNNGKVYVYSVAGQLLATSILTSGEATLRMASKGVYMVKVVTGKTSLSRKLVVMP